MQKTILHIPHSSKDIPLKDGYIANPKDIKEEILKLTDWYTNDLFQHQNAIQVIAKFSRIFCDVERLADEMFYTTLDDGRQLRSAAPKLRNLIYNKYYLPHHDNLSKLVDSQLRKYDRAVIIDCHSFSNKPLNRDVDKTMPRPDICIGIDDFHTPPELISKTKTFFENRGLICEINSPYSGTIVPTQYYLKDSRVVSIMIDVNRDLYLRRGTRIKTAGYQKLKKALNGYLEELSVKY